MSVPKAGLQNSFGLIQLVLVDVDNALSVQHLSVKDTTSALKQCFVYRYLRVVRMSERGLRDRKQYFSSNFNFEGRASRERWLKKSERAAAIALVDEDCCTLDTKRRGPIRAARLKTLVRHFRQLPSLRQVPRNELFFYCTVGCISCYRLWLAFTSDASQNPH